MVAADGYSYSTYNLANIIPTALFMLVIGVFSAALYISHCLCICIHRENYSDGVVQLMERITMIIFKDVFEIVEIEDKEVVTIRKRPVNTHASMKFFNFTIMILICICITFWNVFLIEETFACDPGLDCFFQNDSDSDQLIAQFQNAH